MPKTDNQPPLAEEQKLSMEAIGTTRESYLAKIKWLQENWKGKSDSTATRIICPLIYHNLDFFGQALIADNGDYFQKEYIKIKTTVNPNELLALACLCGSQRVAEVLLKDLGKDCLSPDYAYMLDYVAASRNTVWAVSIARTLVAAGRKMPKMLVTEDEVVLEVLTKVFQPSTVTGPAVPAKTGSVISRDISKNRRP